MRIGSFTLDANLYVFVIVGGLLLLAFLFGEARLRRIALAVIAGLFAADQLSALAATQLANVGWKNANDLIVHLGVLALVAIVLSLGKTVSVGGRFSLRSFVLAILLGATLIAYTQSYLDFAAQETLATDYNLIAIASSHRLLWLIGLLVWLMFLQLWKKKSKDDDDGKGKKGKK